MFIIKADIYGGETRRYLLQPLENASLSHTSLAFLLYMVTIYTRLLALELPYDKKKLSAAGETVSKYYNELPGNTKIIRVPFEQTEPSGNVKVWGYHHQYIDLIDAVLLELYKPKRKRISRG